MSDHPNEPRWLGGRVKIICANCGAAFQGRKSAIYCSKRCRERRWAATHRDRVRELSRKWRKKNAEAVRDRHRRWRTENPEKEREQQRRRHAANPGKWAATQREWRAKHPQRVRAIARQYRAKNREKWLQAIRIWQANKRYPDHPELAALYLKINKAARLLRARFKK